MRILIAGGSGFIGQVLVKHLKKLNYHLTLLTRSKQINIQAYDAIIQWDDLEKIPPKSFDIVINLCGYNIAKKRWSASVKQKIIDSRVESTRRLIQFIKNDSIRLINASAIGFYPFSEREQNENDYLSIDDKYLNFSKQVVDLWENEVNRENLSNAHILRFGVVLGHGGMLNKILPSAKFGLGAVIGSGKQLISWVHIYDVCRAIQYVIEQEPKAKIMNVVAPNPVTQRALITLIAKKLKKPRFLYLPQWTIKCLFGQMGEELLLPSQNVSSKVLEECQFKFHFSTIDEALDDLL